MSRRILRQVNRDTWYRPAQWWWLDAPLAILAVTIAGMTVEPATGVDILGRLSLADRRAIYTDLLQLTTIFAGFGGVIFALYLGLQGRRVKELNRSLGRTLLKIWLAAILTPWLSALTLVVASVFDRGDTGSHNVARWAAIAAILVVAFQMARIVWVFYQLAMLELSEEQPTVRTASKPLKMRRKAS